MKHRCFILSSVEPLLPLEIASYSSLCCYTDKSSECNNSTVLVWLLEPPSRWSLDHVTHRYSRRVLRLHGVITSWRNSPWKAAQRVHISRRCGSWGLKYKFWVLCNFYVYFAFQCIDNFVAREFVYIVTFDFET